MNEYLLFSLDRNVDFFVYRRNYKAGKEVNFLEPRIPYPLPNTEIYQ